MASAVEVGVSVGVSVSLGVEVELGSGVFAAVGGAEVAVSITKVLVGDGSGDAVRVGTGSV